MASWKDRVRSDPKVMFGKPVIAGTRIPVEHILRKLADGMDVEAVLCDYPGLVEEDIQAALAYASDALGSEEILVTGAAS